MIAYMKNIFTSNPRIVNTSQASPEYGGESEKMDGGINPINARKGSSITSSRSYLTAREWLSLKISGTLLFSGRMR